MMINICHHKRLLTIVLSSVLILGMLLGLTGSSVHTAFAQDEPPVGEEATQTPEPGLPTEPSESTEEITEQPPQPPTEYPTPEPGDQPTEASSEPTEVPTEELTQEPTEEQIQQFQTPAVEITEINTYSCQDNLTYQNFLTVDGVEIAICTSFNTGEEILPLRNNLIQQATIIFQNEIVDTITLLAIPYGITPSIESLPTAEIGIKDSYIGIIKNFRISQNATFFKGGLISFLGNETEPLISLIDDPYQNTEDESRLLIAEYLTEKWGRIWLLRIIINIQSGIDNDEINSIIQNNLNNILIFNNNIKIPSSELLSLQDSPNITDEIVISSDLPFPSWWSGDCNVNNHPGSYPLGGSYRGVKACGPHGSSVAVNFGVGVTQYEWQCTELSKRYLYIAYGVPPYSANGKDVVWNCPDTRFEKIHNGTVGKPPQAGDVISYGANTTYGHTSVVSASNVNSSGNGTVTIIEQNATTTGTRTHNVSNWNVIASEGVSGWLHYVQQYIPPPPPTGVGASNGTYTDHVRVSWNSVPAASYYHIYRSTTNSSSSASKIYNGYTSTSFHDTSATPGVLYYYWIKACNNYGCSAFSSSVSGWRNFAPPNDLGASNGTYTDHVRFSWDSVPAASFYHIYRSTTNSSSSASKIYNGYTKTSFHDTSATPGVLYYYWVKACNNYGCSAFSSSVSGWRNFAPPTDLGASNGAYTDHVRFSWDSVPAASFYHIYRSTTNSSSSASKIYNGYTKTSFHDTSATPGVLYYYWVKACSNIGCSAFSTSVSGWRNFDPPIDLGASNGAYTDHVRFSWDSVPAASYYHIYRSTTNSSSSASKIYNGYTKTSFHDTSATPGVLYYYWVKACSNIGCSAFSTSVSGWRNFTSPSGVSASKGTFTDKVALTWTGSTGATSYQIWRGTSSSDGSKLIDGLTSTSYNDTSAMPGITFYYWVKACSAVGCSDLSAYDTGWRMLSTPTNLAASKGTYTDKVALTWSGSTGATSYEVWRGTNSSGGSMIDENLTSTSYNDTSATPGSTFYYWVKACSATGCSELSTYDNGWRMLSAPTNLSASKGTYTNKVSLTWSGSTGATYYEVWRHTIDDSASATSIAQDISTISYNDTSTTPGNTYYYWVKACSATGCSDFSESDTGFVNEQSLPDAPTNLSASKGTYFDKIFLTWSGSTGATSYQVWRHTSDDSASASSITQDISTISYNDTSTTPGSTYYYWVKACSVVGCSDFSNMDKGYRPASTVYITLGLQDGWVLESARTSNKGGSLNRSAATFSVGDDAKNRQYRSILHFNTGALPDNAVITSVKLQVKRASIKGTNPFNTYGALYVDLRKGAFSNNAALQTVDWQAPANVKAGRIPADSISGWHTLNLASANFSLINKTGVTQFRLRFNKQDNGDNGADTVNFYSGNAAAVNRPKLIITYYVP